MLPARCVVGGGLFDSPSMGVPPIRRSSFESSGYNELIPKKILSTFGEAPKGSQLLHVRTDTGKVSVISIQHFSAVEQHENVLCMIWYAHPDRPLWFLFWIEEDRYFAFPLSPRNLSTRVEGIQSIRHEESAFASDSKQGLQTTGVPVTLRLLEADHCKMSDEDVSLTARLDYARLFIRKAYSKIDPELPALLEVLQDVGAAECWHKHGIFLDHLHNVYRTLKLWNVPDSVARCGLFHSSYSNSYVNLALFEPNVDRQQVRDLIGNDAEELVHWFCIVPRHQLIFDMLVSKHSDVEGGYCATHSETLGKAANDKQTTLVPPEGVIVKHILTGEDLLVPRRLIAIFLILTIADFSDQWYSWQDSLFGNSDGKMAFGRNDGTPLWPGDGKPGLWITGVSRMALIFRQILTDEEEYEVAEKEKGREVQSRPFSHIEIKAPPILRYCTATVFASDQVKSMNLYWEAICKQDHDQDKDSAKSCLIRAIRHNPFVAESHIVLAQILLAEGKWEEAQREASEGLKLLLEWGTQWDKRMGWEAWISWARVLQANAEEKTWPKSGWGILNLGLVK